MLFALAHAALALTACLAAPQETAQAATATLLPPGPESWRFERLDLPLSFAPEIDHEGHEELWFAPGMFAPESDSYFSYVFAIRIEEEVDVDAAYLRGFLHSYYAGLCRSVAGSRGLELDLGAIAVDVRPAGEGFAADIAWFDAFTTGAAMDLHVELLVHAQPGATELFGSASPLEEDADVWGELRGLRDAWRAARPAAVLLNHLYLAPDPATYAALTESEFLREAFAVSEVRTTVRADIRYTGLYLYGERTYFEFLSPGPTSPLPSGSSGVFLGVERDEGIDDVANRLRAADLRCGGGPTSREFAGAPVPWFRMLGLEMPAGSSGLFNLLCMEYEAEFLARWHPDLAPQGGGIGRAAVLERYAASLDRHADRAGTLFRDVTAVHLALPEAERARVLKALQVLGFVMEPTTTPGKSIWRGPGFRLLLRDTDGPGRVTGLELALRRSVPRAVHEFGAARLVLEGTAATLTLRGE